MDKKIEYKLVALDIDGTLLNSNHHLLYENIIVIKQLVAIGIKFMLVTGRPDKMAYSYAKDLGIEPIILGYNGATLRNLKTKHINHTKQIAPAVANQICEYLNSIGVYFRIYCLDCVYSFNPWEFDDKKNIYAKYSENLRKSMGFKIIDTLSDIKEDIIKIVVFNEAEDVLSSIRENLKTHNVNIVFGSKNGLDINAVGVNKGDSIIQYAHSLNIDPSEIIAIGDSENDLTMLEAVGMPVTLENGDNKLKEIAKFITKSNNDAGVAYGLKHLYNVSFIDMYKKIGFRDTKFILWGEQRVVENLSVLSKHSVKYSQMFDDEIKQLKVMDKDCILVVSSNKSEKYIQQLLDKDFLYGKDFILLDDYIKILDQPLLHRLKADNLNIEK